MEVTQRNLKLMRLVQDCGDDIGDIAVWPDSVSTETTVNNQIKELRKELKDGGYPIGMIYVCMVHMASVAYSATINRDGVKPAGLKKAWLKISEMLDQEVKGK